MYCLHHNYVLYKATEVICSHTILCTQSNKKVNSKNTIIKYKFTKLMPKSFHKMNCYSV